MTALQREIYVKKAEFEASIGMAPNLLIVTSNEEMRLSEAKIRVGYEIFGMRVVVSDTIDGMTAALVIK